MTTAERTPVFIDPTGRLIVPFIGDAMPLWEGLRDRYKKMRAVAYDRDLRFTYPQTTYRDVAMLIELWERAFAKDYQPGSDVWGMREQWKGYLARIAPEFKGASPDAVFPGNREFWLVQSLKLAIRLSVVRVVPSSTWLAIDAAKDRLVSLWLRQFDLPLHPVKAAEDAARATGEAFFSVLKAGNQWWIDRLARFKWPLLIGAGVLAAVVVAPYVLPRPSAPRALGGR